MTRHRVQTLLSTRARCIHRSFQTTEDEPEINEVMEVLIPVSINTLSAPLTSRELNVDRRCRYERCHRYVRPIKGCEIQIHKLRVLNLVVGNGNTRRCGDFGNCLNGKLRYRKPRYRRCWCYGYERTGCHYRNRKCETDGFNPECRPELIRVRIWTGVPQQKCDVLNSTTHKRSRRWTGNLDDGRTRNCLS